MLNSNACR